MRVLEALPTQLAHDAIRLMARRIYFPEQITGTGLEHSVGERVAEQAAGGETLRSIISLIVGLVTLYLGYKFFMYSLGFLSSDPPRVTAGLMAGLAGFTFTAAAVTLLRDWIIMEKAGSGQGD